MWYLEYDQIVGKKTNHPQWQACRGAIWASDDPKRNFITAHAESVVQAQRDWEVAKETDRRSPRLVWEERLEE